MDAIAAVLVALLLAILGAAMVALGLFVRLAKRRASVMAGAS